MTIIERNPNGTIKKKVLSTEEAKRIASIVPRNKKKRKLKREVKNE